MKQQALGDVLLPNAPDNKFNLGLVPWAAGVFRGIVPQYDLVNLGATYHLSDRIGFGVDVSNVLDDEHYEAFGGDLMSRRALGFVTLGW